MPRYASDPALPEGRPLQGMPGAGGTGSTGLPTMARVGAASPNPAGNVTPPQAVPATAAGVARVAAAPAPAAALAKAALFGHGVPSRTSYSFLADADGLIHTHTPPPELDSLDHQVLTSMLDRDYPHDPGLIRRGYERAVLPSEFRDALRHARLGWKALHEPGKPDPRMAETETQVTPGAYRTRLLVTDARRLGEDPPKGKKGKAPSGGAALGKAAANAQAPQAPSAGLARPASPGLKSPRTAGPLAPAKDWLAAVAPKAAGVMPPVDGGSLDGVGEVTSSPLPALKAPALKAPALGAGPALKAPAAPAPAAPAAAPKMAALAKAALSTPTAEQLGELAGLSGGAGLSLAPHAALLGGALGAARAPKGEGARGAGRGALAGAATGFGVGAGGLAGLGLAGSLADPSNPLPALAAGGLGGAALGGLAGHGLANYVMGEAPWDKEGMDKEAFNPAGLAKGLGGLASKARGLFRGAPAAEDLAAASRAYASRGAHAPGAAELFHEFAAPGGAALHPLPPSPTPTFHPPSALDRLPPFHDPRAGIRLTGPAPTHAPGPAPSGPPPWFAGSRPAPRPPVAFTAPPPRPQAPPPGPPPWEAAAQGASPAAQAGAQAARAGWASRLKTPAMMGAGALGGYYDAQAAAGDHANAWTGAGGAAYGALAMHPRLIGTRFARPMIGMSAGTSLGMLGDMYAGDGGGRYTTLGARAGLGAGLAGTARQSWGPAGGAAEAAAGAAGALPVAAGGTVAAMRGADAFIQNRTAAAVQQMTGKSPEELRQVVDQVGRLAELGHNVQPVVDKLAGLADAILGPLLGAETVAGMGALEKILYLVGGGTLLGGLASGSNVMSGLGGAAMLGGLAARYGMPGGAGQAPQAPQGSAPPLLANQPPPRNDLAAMASAGRPGPATDPYAWSGTGRFTGNVGWTPTGPGPTDPGMALMAE